MRQLRRLAVVLLLSSLAGVLWGGTLPPPPALPAIPPASPAPRHAVMVSIDGLMPAYYREADALGLAIPNLRRLMAEGAYARGVVGVLPSVTYPSHTTLITGVPPRLHGIAANTFFDPEGISDEAWNWYARAVRVPTLASAARARGLTVGAVSWPVSIGLPADWNVPEFWRPRSHHASDLELLAALSTPGLLDAVAAARGVPLASPLSEADRVDVAIHILETHRPALLLLHLFEVDHQQHEHGPRSPEALAAVEESDAALGRLLAAVERAGL